MEEIPNFCAMLTLKEIALRRVATIMWSKTEILASFDEVGNENKVKAAMSKLGLPPLLTEQLKHMVIPIQSEISEWKMFHEDYLNNPEKSFNVKILEQVYWTSLGTIDYGKTAENLIRLEMLYLHQRYRLACLYCLDDSIADFSEKFPESGKKHLYKEEPFEHATLPPVEFCWPYVLKGEESKLNRLVNRATGNLDTFNKYAFEHSARKGNLTATRYYFRKLTNAEKEASLFITAEATLKHRMEICPYRFLEHFPEEKLSETICYLLSQMGKEQQIQMCKEKSCNILTCFLDWPRQNLFWNVAELLWPFLTEADYLNLLRRMILKIKYGDCLTKLLQEFFVRCPYAFKKDFVYIDDRHFSFLRALFDLQDSETLKLVFKNLDSEDRKKLVSYKDTFHLFCESISRGYWHLVELCLQETTLSQEEKEELKEVYCAFIAQTRTATTCNANGRERIWKQLLEFFDKSPVGTPGQKNSLEYEPAKKKPA